MSFKEIFEKYKSGSATEEECKYIEEEIEKNELITEYLSENFFEDFQMEDSKDIEAPETKNITKAVNKKLRKSVVISVISVGILVAIINFIFLPLYNSLFYNPNRGYKDDMGVTQFFIDMSTFTDLHYPGYITSWDTSAEALGFGKYNIRVTQKDRFHNTEEISYSKLIRNNMEDNLTNDFYKFPPANAWKDDVSPGLNNSEETKKYYQELSKDLPKSSYISAYVNFKEDISLKEFSILQNKYPLDYTWIAIRGADKIGYTPQVGFEPYGAGAVLSKGVVSEENYPCFDLGLCHEGDLNVLPEEHLENHFKSTLKYIATREDFLNSFARVNGISTELYKNTLEYVEKNGVKSYGVLVYGKVDQIWELINDENVESIMINDVKLSSISR